MSRPEILWRAAEGFARLVSMAMFMVLFRGRQPDTVGLPPAD